ncbi:MAG: GIY-YIG nuclease family protein [Fimbriimonadaceae bacterium]|nr:GIY-YIG nuclease family protein [Fimbriimonadaceae bacterium]
MWIVYILQSDSNGRYYVGQTIDLCRRLREHASGQTPSTRGRGPYTLVHTESYASRSEATKRERSIKAWKSAVAVRALIESATSD